MLRQGNKGDYEKTDMSLKSIHITLLTFEWEYKTKTSNDWEWLCVLVFQSPNLIKYKELICEWIELVEIHEKIHSNIGQIKFDYKVKV